MVSSSRARTMAIGGVGAAARPPGGAERWFNRRRAQYTFKNNEVYWSCEETLIGTAKKLADALVLMFGKFKQCYEKEREISLQRNFRQSLTLHHKPHSICA